MLKDQVLSTLLYKRGKGKHKIHSAVITFLLHDFSTIDLLFHQDSIVHSTRQGETCQLPS